MATFLYLFLAKRFAMLSKTNLEHELIKRRTRRVSSESLLNEVMDVFTETDTHRDAIKRQINSASGSSNENVLQIELLQSERIFHKNEIQHTCIEFRLRFLDARFFKGNLPEEAISEIRNMENQHQTKLNSFKIMAPASLLKLESADDPLLFASLGNDYYYLIHKWGNDLHPLRKWLMWPYRNFENLIFMVFVLSLLFTWITPMQIFTKGTPSISEYLLLFLFMFKAVGGVVLFYGFAKGKNFNEAIWDSKYYNA